MTPIEAAIEDIKSLEPGEKVNIAMFARKHGVDRTTLSKRYRGVWGSQEA